MARDDLRLVDSIHPMRAWVDEYGKSADLQFLLLTPEYDDAIIGVSVCFEPGGRMHRVVYDYPRLLEIIAMEIAGDNEVTEDVLDEATEHFEFNIIGAYCGENMPAYLDRPVDWKGDDDV